MTELEAARAFVALAPADGEVPASKPYLPCRDEEFIRNWKVGATRSTIARPGTCVNLEDAREAIEVGRRAGYRDSDIAAYLMHNYALDTAEWIRR